MFPSTCVFVHSEFVQKCMNGDHEQGRKDFCLFRFIFIVVITISIYYDIEIDGPSSAWGKPNVGYD